MSIASGHAACRIMHRIVITPLVIVKMILGPLAFGTEHRCGGVHSQNRAEQTRSVIPTFSARSHVKAGLYIFIECIFRIKTQVQFVPVSIFILRGVAEITDTDIIKDFICASGYRQLIILHHGSLADKRIPPIRPVCISIARHRAVPHRCSPVIRIPSLISSFVFSGTGYVRLSDILKSHRSIEAKFGFPLLPLFCGDKDNAV